MRAPCDRLAELMPALVDGDEAASPVELSHVESCLRCQAELARYRRLARLLAQLKHEREELPPGLVCDVLASVERVARRGAASSGSRRRAVFVAGLTATVTLGGLGLALASRARPLVSRGRRSAAGL
jgi:hypothetical protein